MKTEEKKTLRPYAKVRIIGSEPFFGPGPAKLLMEIKENGSVAAACEKVGMSYSKGRSLIRKMENELDFELVSRTQGGRQGGSSSLTKEGEEFLRRYREFEKDVAGYADKVFPLYFSEVKEQ